MMSGQVPETTTFRALRRLWYEVMYQGHPALNMRKYFSNAQLRRLKQLEPDTFAQCEEEALAWIREKRRTLH